MSIHLAGLLAMIVLVPLVYAVSLMVNWLVDELLGLRQLTQEQRAAKLSRQLTSPVSAQPRE
jgi:hypothetical protein